MSKRKLPKIPLILEDTGLMGLTYGRHKTFPWRDEDGSIGTSPRDAEGTSFTVKEAKMGAPKTAKQFMVLPEVAAFTRVEHTITKEDVSLGFFSLNVGGDVRRVPVRDFPVGKVLSFPVMNSFCAVWNGEADISRVVTKDGAFHLAQDGAGNYVRVRQLG